MARSSNYICPEDAFQILKKAGTMGTPVFISGFAGFGKTELIKQFFASRKYMYFTCRSGEPDLSVIPSSNEGKRRMSVVIDDLQLMFAPKNQERVLDLAMRKDIWLILISRSRDLNWFGRIYMDRSFSMIDEELLQFDTDKTRQYLALSHITASEEMLHKITAVTNGNVYFLRGIMHQLPEGGRISEKHYQTVRKVYDRYLEYVIMPDWPRALLDFMMQMSVVDEFNAELAEFVTGNPYVSQIINEAFETGNFIYHDGEYYHIRPIVLDFLRKKADEFFGTLNMNDYAYNAGLYYELHDDIPRALRLYEKSGKIGRIHELLVRNSRRNPSNSYYYDLRKYYLKLPKTEIIGDPIMMSGMSMMYSLLMETENSEYWYGQLQSYSETSSGIRKREAIGRLLYLDIALPHRGSASTAGILVKIPSYMVDQGIRLPEFSITSNMPSVMNSGKDFCEWSKSDTEIFKNSGYLLQEILGRYGKGIASISLGESYYEKGESSRLTMPLINQGILEAEHGGVMESVFSGIGIMCRIHLSDGDLKTAEQLAESFEARCREQGEPALIPNVRAMRLRIALYNGNQAAITRWLKEAPDETHEFFIMERYRYLTKIRTYLTANELTSARSLLDKLSYYAEKYDRHYLTMELGLLRAIVQYRSGSKSFKNTLIGALAKICTYKFTRLISREGIAVYPLLKAIREQAIHTAGIDPDWFRRVYLETEEMAIHYPLYLKPQNTGLLNFSEHAITVLKLQAEGLTLQQIADREHMKLETVRYHAKTNYKKLNVNGKADAVLSARNLGLI